MKSQKKSQSQSLQTIVATSTKTKQLSPADEASAIQKALGLLTFELQPRKWLDTGSRRLNAVLGSEEKGIGYGKMIELFGPESNGKTLLALLLAGLAQEDGAPVAWVDFENSFDADWAKTQGVDPDKMYHFFPKIIQKSKKEKPRLQTAEELCDEVEMWMVRRHDAGEEKMFVFVDSVTAMLVEEELEAGNQDANMRTKVALASFLSRLLRRWVALSQVYSAGMLFINQLREAPGGWGNPERTPGGKALKFYCSIRARVQRVKNGKLLHNGKMVGLRAIIRNLKNKAGEGSVEGCDVGFKALFRSNDWRFVDAAKLKKDAEEGE
jgi:recombination protein RecA